MEQKPKFKPNSKLKLMDQVREVLRYYHYAYRTETNYCYWILRYIHFYRGKTCASRMSISATTTFSSEAEKAARMESS